MSKQMLPNSQLICVFYHLNNIHLLNLNINFNNVFNFTGQEENLYAKKNYDKYLSALKNSGLVSVEEKPHSATADVGAGAEGGAGAMVLLGKITLISKKMLDCFFTRLPYAKSIFFN